MDFSAHLIRPEKYIETSISLRISNAIDTANKFKDVVVVRGHAGVGKSSALAERALKDDNCAICTISQTEKTIRRLLLAVADAFSGYTRADSAAGVERYLVGWLSRNAERGEYLVIDEIQNVGLDGIRALLSLHERTKLPMVLCGNYAAIKKTQHNALVWDQVATRILKWVDLPGPIPEDIRLIGQEWGVEGDDAFAILVAYAQRKSLREMVKLLGIASKSYAEGNPIRRAGIEASLRFLHDNNTTKIRELTKKISLPNTN